MTTPEALQLLQTQPMEVLRKNSVTPFTIMVGGAPVPAGVYTYHMVEDALAQIHRPRNLSGNLMPKAGQRFKIQASASPNSIPFHAIHIPVQPSNIPINAYPLDIVGPGLMITTQLTGCCIVMVPGGGTWSVAHLQPTGENGAALQARLAQAGVKVYGANDYAGNRAALVGVREAGNWSFYVQTQDANFNVLKVKKLSA